MANEIDDDRFTEFLYDLKETYPGTESKVLKFLLYDNLEISVLATEDGLQFFNQLHRQGDISYNDVNILLEIAKLTKRQQSISLINGYIAKYIPTDVPMKKGNCLSPYREILYKSLVNLEEKDLQNVNGFYRLNSRGFDNIWDAVFYLEKEGRLDETQEKIRRFSKSLNDTAKRILLGFIKATAEDGPGASTVPADTRPAIPATGGQKSSLTVPSLDMTDEKFRAMLIKLSDWYQGKEYLNMLKLLFKDTIERAKLASYCTVKDLLLEVKDTGLLHQTKLRILMDMIKVTNTRGVLTYIKVLSGVYDDAEVTSFTPHRRSIIQLGNDLSKKESETLGDLYGIARSDYNNSDQWLLIMKLEDDGKFTKMKDFIQDLKDIGLGHAARKLEDATAKNL